MTVSCAQARTTKHSSASNRFRSPAPVLQNSARRAAAPATSVPPNRLTLPLPKAQAGYYTDAETGLIYCHNRYYDSAKGRWLTRDPIGYAGGINLYAYCENNPIKYVDPDGLDVKTPIVVRLPGKTGLFVDTDGSGPSHGDTKNQIVEVDEVYRTIVGNKIGNGAPNADLVPYLVRRGPGGRNVKKGDFAVAIYGGEVVAAAFMDTRNEEGFLFEEASVFVHRAFGHNPFPPKARRRDGVNFAKPVIIIAFPGTTQLNNGAFTYDWKGINKRVGQIINNDRYFNKLERKYQDMLMGLRIGAKRTRPSTID